MSRLAVIAMLFASVSGVGKKQNTPNAVEPPLPVFHAKFPEQIPLPKRKRVLVPPESVGVENTCPFPTVKEPVYFQCPQCGLKMKTHVLYPCLPHCPKDRWVMNEIEKW